MYGTRSHTGRLAVSLVLALGLSLGCSGKKKGQAARTAPTQGVVGKVLEVKGAVSYSATAQGKREPLRKGMELRAEWTVHTGDDASVRARLTNGHLWTLSSGLSKQVRQIRALTLAPTKAGALDKLADLGASKGMDRSAAAGLHQERTAAGKAAPTRPPVANELDLRLNEAPVRPAPLAQVPKKAEKPPKKKTSSTKTKGGRKSAMSRRSSQRRISARVGSRDGERGSGSTMGRRRGVRRTPAPGRSKPLSGLLGGAPMGGSKTTAKTKSGSLPKRLSVSHVRSRILQLTARFRSCMKQKKVTGTLRVRITIRGATGRVSGVNVSGRSASDPVVRCMRSRAGSVRFGKFSDATMSVKFLVKNP